MGQRCEKLTKKQHEEIVRAAHEYEHLSRALWEAMLTNLADRLNLAIDEIEDDFGSLT